MLILEYIEKKIKAYKRTYKTKTGETKETTPNLSIYLGNQTHFKPNESVIIIAKQEFQELLNNSTETPETKQEIKELKQNLETEKNNTKQILNKCNNKTKQIQELQQTINNLETELNKTKQELKEETTKYNNAIDKKETLYNNLVLSQQETKNLINENAYLDKIIIAYESMGALNRLLKRNPKNKIAKPETIEITQLETNK